MSWNVIEKPAAGIAVAPDALLLTVLQSTFKGKLWRRLVLRFGRGLATRLGANESEETWLEFALGRDENKGRLRLRKAARGSLTIRAHLSRRGILRLNAPVPASWGGRIYRAVKLRHELIEDRAGLTLIADLPVGWETEPDVTAGPERAVEPLVRRAAATPKMRQAR